MRPPPLLDAGHVSVGFAGVAALANVSLALWPARVHALIGENGASKSTLINVLTGVLKPDAGELRWRGAPVRLATPQQAARLGISVVHQEPQLVATMTALDNLFIGERFPTVGRTPFVARAAMRRLANAAFERLGVALPLDAKVADLSATEKTLLALARCVLREPALLILDEPSAALTTHDAARLLQTLDRLRAGGTAVVYVSHRLDEVLRIADDITVLCNGSVVATLLAAGQTHASVVEAMSRGGAAGAQAPGRRELPSARPAAGARAASSTARPRLRLQNVHSRDGRVRGVSLDLHAGEIVGVYGLAGSGRTELLELLVGLRALAAGRVEDGMEADGPAQAPVRGPHDAAQRGRVLIPEDRRGHALVLRMRVRENLSLPLLRRFARFGLLSRRRERDAAVRAMRSLDVKARGPEQIIAELSGGNQQKVVFARALALQADVLLCDEPTQAVDVATRQAIHRLLRERVAAGGAVLLVTSDLAEMLELADRIVVLRAGAGVATLVNAALHPEDVLRWCFEPRRAEPPGEAAAADAKCAPPAPSPSPTPAGTVVPAGSAALGRRAP